MGLCQPISTMAVNTNINLDYRYYRSCSDIIVWNINIKRTVWLLIVHVVLIVAVLCLSGVPSSQCAGAAGQSQHHCEVHHQTPGPQGCCSTGTHTSDHRPCTLLFQFVLFSISSIFHDILQVDYSLLPSSPGSSDDLSWAWSRWPVLDPLVDHPHSCSGRHPVANSTGLHTVEGNTCTLYTPSIACTCLSYVLSDKTDIYMKGCFKKDWNIQDGRQIWTLVPH